MIDLDIKKYIGGIDIGSTTVKLVILDELNNILFADYRRHHAHTQETLKTLLKEARTKLGPCLLKLKITGSGSINLAKAIKIEFIQEVVAVAKALKLYAPQTDVAIELGGEDAKIIYFKNGLDERMNGVCAGGTGSFIDQMADLLETDAAGLNEAAKDYRQIYPIAARCGVFAKTDIQPLINEGATKADLAVSIFQAVVNQTISGLACGKPIRGHVAFLGGPLHFLTELKKCFIRTLNLNDETAIDLDNSHLFAAIGAAIDTQDVEAIDIDKLIADLDSGIKVIDEMPRLEPLFKDEAELKAFKDRHHQSVVAKADIKEIDSDVYLGIDAGSTTTKLVLIDKDGRLLFSHYSNNHADPIKTAKEAIAKLKAVLPANVKIARACSTGYGESLLKAAFNLDEGVVETIAHSTAASFFDPDVDCVLDIGGQDMKCIKLKNGSVDTILLNEACSSGCGSFIENFASSLGYSVKDFANIALMAKKPVDLGTRCTVFMNSNVKQAQKEGANVEDISAGLAYSVIKNALYKVIKLSSASDLGKHIVVQGGTFHNLAVLRAFEKIAGVDATCPDISGLMGAFGAALVAKNHDKHQGSTMLELDKIINLSYKSISTRCGGCTNRCMLTINTFEGNRRHVSGNRCEKGAGKTTDIKHAPNMMEFKRKRIFDYKALDIKDAKYGEIAIPRVLNMYENFPFWATFFKDLGFKVVLSPFASRDIYQMGMESIPSESECYPAKMAHGQVEWLIKHGHKTIFHPCVFYEHQETVKAQNHYNCPIVVSYAENIKNNVESIEENDVKYIRPFIAFTSEEIVAKRLIQVCKENWDIPAKTVKAAVHKAWAEQIQAKIDIRNEGTRLLKEMEANHAKGIVLAGRPYHIDPEINHGISEMIASYGLTVFTEDSLPFDLNSERPIRVVDQWVYHSRLYNAAEFVAKRDDLELIQLTSFGCGLDAVTSDQVNEILEKANKLYTLIKIDEVNNLGAVRIRIRSLLAAMEMRDQKCIHVANVSQKYERQEFTKEMRDSGYTIIAPQMSPIHFEILEPILKKHNYNIVVLDNDNREAIDTGLKYVNNDACFPSITVVGQIMQAVLSGKYDNHKLAIIMSQTGGCCRASNYVAIIRRALDKAGLSYIPVISLNLNGMEKNSGMSFSLNMVKDVARAVVYGDLFMRCLYRTRPYELVKGSADALHAKLRQECIKTILDGSNLKNHIYLCNKIVNEFDNLPLNENLKKPRVAVVGEILVKYMPLANNHIVDVLEREGAEAVVPDLMDFLNYCLYNNNYKHEYLGNKKRTATIANLGIRAIAEIRKPAIEALKASKRFEAPEAIDKIAEMTKPFLSIGNQYGEGWFLTGEMLELIHANITNIICIQPFACLPNHVVGKGVIKKLQSTYPNANIAAIDYDSSASEVNQLNRIKLLLSAAKSKQELETN